MGFIDSSPQFKEREIKFVESIGDKLKSAVGTAIDAGAMSSGSSNNDEEYQLNDDFIDRAITYEIGKISNDSHEHIKERRTKQKTVKKYEKYNKEVNKQIIFEKEANNELYKVFRYKDISYRECEEKHITTKWNDEEAKSKSKQKISEMKDEAQQAFDRLKSSDDMLNVLAGKREELSGTINEAKAASKREKSDYKTDEKKIGALKTILASKRELEKGSSLSSDDLIASGKQGMAGALLNVINPIEHAKNYLITCIMGIIAETIASVVAFFVPIILAILVLVSVLFALSGICTSTINVVGGVFSGAQYNSLLSDNQINEMILERGWEWRYDYDRYGVRIEGSEHKVSTLPESQQNLLRFAFSRVGYPYSQDYRTSGSYYDCSSLAYYTEASIGKDITCATAASQAKKLNRADKRISSDSPMQIGDLIYYGGHDNGRYLGIYHVAIYVGNGYCVEAFNKEKGVIYAPVRSKNAVMICRP